MKRFLPALLLVALGWNAALAVSSYVTYLPVVRSAPAPIQTTPIILYDGASALHDAISLADTRPGAAPGSRRYFVAWAKVPAYHLQIDEDVGGVLVPVSDPVLQLALAPSWQPDNPKNGGAAMVEVPGGLRVYYTGRKPDEPTGVFRLYRTELPIAPAPPVPLRPPNHATPVDGRKSATPTP